MIGGDPFNAALVSCTCLADEGDLNRDSCSGAVRRVRCLQVNKIFGFYYLQHVL